MMTGPSSPRKISLNTETVAAGNSSEENHSEWQRKAQKYSLVKQNSDGQSLDLLHQSNRPSARKVFPSTPKYEGALPLQFATNGSNLKTWNITDKKIDVVTSRRSNFIFKTRFAGN